MTFCFSDSSVRVDMQEQGRELKLQIRNVIDMIENTRGANRPVFRIDFIAETPITSPFINSLEVANPHQRLFRHEQCPFHSAVYIGFYRK